MKIEFEKWLKKNAFGLYSAYIKDPDYKIMINVTTLVNLLEKAWNRFF